MHKQINLSQWFLWGSHTPKFAVKMSGQLTGGKNMSHQNYYAVTNHRPVYADLFHRLAYVVTLIIKLPDL